VSSSGLRGFSNSILEAPSQPGRLRIHPVLRDLAVTAATSAANFLAGLIVVAAVSRFYGVLLLGEYLLLRRVSAWLVPLVNLGLGVGLPRFVAYSHKSAPERQVEYFVAAFVSVVSSTLLLGSVLGLMPQMIDRLLFGGTQYSRLNSPLFLLLLGSVAYATVYGYYRGRLQMTWAAVIQLAIALTPLLALGALHWTTSVAMLSGVMGGLYLVVAIVFAIPLFSRFRFTSIRQLPERAVELLQYGALRVPGDMSAGALLAVSPIVAAHYLPLSQVSFLLVAGSVLAMATVSTEPLGLVFLSKISMLLAEQRGEESRAYLSHLMSAVVDISIFGAIQMIVFADVLMGAWLGASSLPGVPIVRITAVGIPFYLFYTALRSALDAGSQSPLNAQNTVTALLALLAFIFICVRWIPRVWLLQAFACSIVLAMSLLAYCTRRSLTKVFSITIQWSDSFVPILCALALGTIALVVRRLTAVTLLRLCGLELCFGLMFASVCFHSKTKWLQLLITLVVHRFTPAAGEITPAES